MLLELLIPVPHTRSLSLLSILSSFFVLSLPPPPSPSSSSSSSSSGPKITALKFDPHSTCFTTISAWSAFSGVTSIELIRARGFIAGVIRNSDGAPRSVPLACPNAFDPQATKACFHTPSCATDAPYSESSSSSTYRAFSNLSSFDLASFMTFLFI